LPPTKQGVLGSNRRALSTTRHLLLSKRAPFPQIWTENEERRRPPTATRPLPRRGLGGVHRTRFQKKKDKNPTHNKFPLTSQQNLFTSCKFCMIFEALIPVMDYNAQITFERG